MRKSNTHLFISDKYINKMLFYHMKKGQRIVYSDENIALASQEDELIKRLQETYIHINVAKMGKVVVKTASGKKLLIKPIVAVRQTERAIELLRQGSETSFLKPYLAKPIIWTFHTTAFSDGVRIAMSPVFAHMMLLLGNKSKESQIEEITKSARDDSDYNYRINMAQSKYIQFILIHECYHALYLHILRSLLKIGRGSELEHDIANIAMDMEINRDIEGQLPFYSGCTKDTGGIWFMDEIWKNKETDKFFTHEVWEDIYDYLWNHREKLVDKRLKATSNTSPQLQLQKNPRKSGWDKAIKAIKTKQIDPMDPFKN